MKAWRKHNASSYVRKHPKMRINRNERATFFSAESVPIPSDLLMAMFKQVGLPTPSITP